MAVAVGLSAVTIFLFLLCTAITLDVIKDIEQNGLKVRHIIIMVVGLPITIIAFIIKSLREPYGKLQNALDKPVNMKRDKGE